MQAPEGCLGRQSWTGVCHATRVVIPKARRLPANNTTAHSWPEISSPKHPRHVPASVSHSFGFHPPAAPSWRCPRSRRHQHRRLGQGRGSLPSPGTPQRHPPTQAREEGCVHPEKWTKLQVVLPAFQAPQARQTRPAPPPSERTSDRQSLRQWGSYGSPPPTPQGVWAPHLAPFSPQLSDITAAPLP